MKIVQAIGFGFIGLIALCVLMGSGVVPGAYNTVENNGTPLTKRSILNFPNSGCADNSGNQSTDCTFLTATTVPGNYTQSFVSQTSVILTHNLNTTAVIVQCYDAASPPALIIPNTTKITDANDVTVTFSASQSGKCQVSGSNASGGGGGGGGNAVLASLFLPNDGMTSSTSDVALSPSDTITFSIASTQTIVISYNSICYNNTTGNYDYNSLYIDGTHVTTSPNADWQNSPNVTTPLSCPLNYAGSLLSGTHTIVIQHRLNSAGATGEWWNRMLFAMTSN